MTNINKPQLSSLHPHPTSEYCVPPEGRRHRMAEDPQRIRVSVDVGFIGGTSETVDLHTDQRCRLYADESLCCVRLGVALWIRSPPNLQSFDRSRQYGGCSCSGNRSSYCITCHQSRDFYTSKLYQTDDPAVTRHRHEPFVCFYKSYLKFSRYSTPPFSLSAALKNTPRWFH